MSGQANELLNMFINDAFSPSGKIKKKTALKMMVYINTKPELQALINAGDYEKVISYKHQHNRG